jgi:hypothetical protein
MAIYKRGKTYWHEFQFNGSADRQEEFRRELEKDTEE